MLGNGAIKSKVFELTQLNRFHRLSFHLRTKTDPASETCSIFRTLDGGQVLEFSNPKWFYVLW
jgi:hypothetical protein